VGNFTGDAGNNVLTGTDDFDVLDGQAGNDTLKGGKGNDHYIVDSAKDVVVEALNSGRDIVFSTAASYTLGANVEVLVLNSGAQNGTGNALDNDLDGNAAANVLSGLGGNDTLDGNGGLDLLDGGAGNDVLFDSGDADTLKGGTGNDVYKVFTDNSVIVEAAGGGTDEVQANGIGFSLVDLKAVENLTLLGVANTTGTGNALANKITGNAGANLLAGNEGNDTLDGGAGADVMFGSIGNDTFIVDDANDQAIEGFGGGTKDTVLSAIDYALLEGSDIELLTLTGNESIDGTGNSIANLITGNGSGNRLDGGKGDDTLTGGAGDDRLIGGLGKDVLIGGKENDIYVVDDVGDKVVELAGLAIQGRDRVESSLKSYTLAANIEDLNLLAGAANGTGNSLANNINGNDAANKLEGGAGNDDLDGREGSDTLLGGAGNDDLDGEAGFDLVDGGAGNDTLFDFLGGDTLNGGAGNDFYVLQFVDSADTLIVEAANGGIDSVMVQDASFSLADFAHVENLQIAGNGFSATGNDRANRLIGNAFVNQLDGGKGNDTLDGGAGADILIGGVGNDVYIVDNAADQATEAKGGGKDTVQSSVSFTLGAGQEIELLQLTGNGDISGTGNAFANAITGNSGDNQLNGDLGNDTLSGGDGDDRLAGGTGDDSLFGGKGDDTYFIAAAGDKITELVNQGIDTVVSNLVSTKLGANVENLRLSEFAINGTGNTLANDIDGNIANNLLDGGAGNDSLDGATGNDLLLGGVGNDILVGGEGDDDLRGGAGNDVLDGGLFGDRLTGGAGKDRFVISTAAELGQIGIDLITDFTRGSDTIDLRSLLSDFEISADDAFSEGHIILQVFDDETSIRFSAAGGGQGAITLAVADGVALTEADFTLTGL
jgi:Ca2+-binding RTX toxin-like protein